jgi:hypothetical protein
MLQLATHLSVILICTNNFIGVALLTQDEQSASHCRATHPPVPVDILVDDEKSLPCNKNKDKTKLETKLFYTCKKFHQIWRLICILVILIVFS